MKRFWWPQTPVVVVSLGAASAVLAACGGGGSPHPSDSSPVGPSTPSNNEVSSVPLQGKTGGLAPVWKSDSPNFGSGNNQLECQQPQNVTVTDEGLVITAKKEPVLCGTSSTPKQYTSGSINTMDSVAVGPGTIITVKVNKLPNGKGLWPAFWMRPVGGGNGEIGILEAVGAKNVNDSPHFAVTIHHDYDKKSPSHQEKQGKNFTINDFDPNKPHTFQLKWSESSLDWLIDNNLVFHRDTTTTSWFKEVFNKPYFFRANLAVGGTMPDWAATPSGSQVTPGVGSPDASTSFPAQFIIGSITTQPLKQGGDSMNPATSPVIYRSPSAPGSGPASRQAALSVGRRNAVAV